jgi:hypothetical protein
VKESWIVLGENLETFPETPTIFILYSDLRVLFILGIFYGIPLNRTNLVRENATGRPPSSSQQEVRYHCRVK